MKHLTARLSWHDDKWNGNICRHPKENGSCTAPNSLLSERVARRKNSELEAEHAKEKIDKFLPEYIPPCFWSANAFSPNPAEVVFRHPFPNLEKEVGDSLSEYSIYTWPFRLAFTHSKKEKKKHGRYHPELKERISHFFDKFEPDKTIVFFYLDYDNPVSADEHKYALVGCSKLAEIGDFDDFQFNQSELEEIRSDEGMDNFPTVNWAIEVSHKWENTGIRLPYHEYLEYVEENPEEWEMLEEMRVLVDEEELTSRFKYVAEEVDSDQCLYLLYKLRRAIKKVQEHPVVEDYSREEELIDDYIQEVWKRRGLYPGLPNVISLLINPDTEEVEKGEKIVSLVKKNLPPDEDVLDYILEIVRGGKETPDYLSQLERPIRKARRRIREYEPLLGLLRKLCLFSLTKFQLKRILFPNESEDVHPFGGKTLAVEEIEDNPYLLCEEYTPITEEEEKRNEELDRLDIRDEPISLFTIDIGMFPDEDYIESNMDLQDLMPTSPERMRAVIINYLRRIGDRGNCYASLDSVLQRIREHPLFYKQIENENLLLRENQFKKKVAKEHFDERLDLVEKGDKTFFYLQEVKRAEEIVEEVVENLVGRESYDIDLSWVDGHVDEENQKMKGKIEGFDPEQFREERRKVYRGALKSSFYVISGKPGSGKTFVLREIAKRIQEDFGENLTLLTPTGKAALRVKEETDFEGAQTIDRFIYKNEYSECLENFENLLDMEKKGSFSIENLIIDEASMVNLQRLSVLFNMLKLQGLRNVKRVILVGDNHQLPPIGYGSPFHDIVESFKRNKEKREKHFAYLRSNCRQEYDPQVLKAAEIFRGKNRYYSEMLDRLLEGGEISKGLTVEGWEGEELREQLGKRLDTLVDGELSSEEEEGREEKLNKVFGLYESGFVPKNRAENLHLDKFQIITPYRAGRPYGAISLNEFIRDEYKDHEWQPKEGRSSFFHSDKVMRTTNWYQWNPKASQKELALSNGSIGVICDHGKKGVRRGYFPDYSLDYPFFTWDRIDGEENFELAYAITVHKSQGSDFDNTFVVIPKKRGLLTRELIYTALTRSKGQLTLFVQEPENKGKNPLEVARDRSHLLRRNTSLFSDPTQSWWALFPDTDDWVRSRAEYILYRALKEKEDEDILQFRYEEPLELETEEGNTEIKPDFTLEVNGNIYYWEHLGLLDRKDYYSDWRNRRSLYENNGLGDALITTDDMNGIQHMRINQVITDVVNNDLIFTGDSRFSNHHYKLYTD